MINSASAVRVPSTRLSGRRAFITGGGSGIGRATALRLAAEGASILVGDIDPVSAEGVVEEIRQSGSTAESHALDVTDDASVGDAVEFAVRQFGGLDIVAACAGISHPAATHEMSLDAWDTMLRVNLTGVFSTVRHTVPRLIDGGGGAIVTIGSVASLVAAGQAAAYDASKGGVLQFTRAIAVEYVEHGIRANCVCPGLVKTSLAANSRKVTDHFDSSGRMRSASDRVDAPIQGYADPALIASSVAFLASDDAAFITGIALPVDGGYTAV